MGSTAIPGGSAISSRGQTSFFAMAVKEYFAFEKRCKWPKQRHFIDADIRPHFIVSLQQSVFWGTKGKKRGSGNNRVYRNLKQQLETCLDEVQVTVALLVNEAKHPKRGCSKSVRQSTYGCSKKGSSPCSAHQTDKKDINDKSNQATCSTTCTHELCVRHTTHKTEGFLFAKHAAETGANP